MNRFAWAVAAVLAAAPASRADILIDVFPSLAPNIFGSPSWPGYVANAIPGIGAGGAAVGNPGLPTYYSSIPDGGSTSLSNIIVTNFPSWRGAPFPPPPFAGEFGNRLHFGVRVASDDGLVSLSNLDYDITDTLDGELSLSGSFTAADSYSPTRVGVLFNATGPPTFVTSGSATQGVNEIWYVGIGSGYEILESGLPGGVPPADLASLLGVTDPFDVSGTYTYRNENGDRFSGSATVTINPAGGPDPNPIPAPAGLVLGLLGAAGLVGVRLRRKAPRAV